MDWNQPISWKDNKQINKLGNIILEVPIFCEMFPEKGAMSADIPARLIEPGFPKLNREGKGDHIGIIAFLLAGLAIYKKRRRVLLKIYSISSLVITLSFY